jgi:hypothetical protein
MPDSAGKRSRGRPARYLDAADKQAAYRERQAQAAALGAAARALIDKPTLPFVTLIMGRLLAQAADPDALRAQLLDQLAAAPPVTSTT